MVSNKSDINRALQAQKMAGSLNFGFKKRDCTICVAKTTVLIDAVLRLAFRICRLSVF